MLKRSIPPESGIELTWDPPRSTGRREIACPRTKGKPFCDAENINLGKGIGLGDHTSGLVSCDEFPFASTEEGGHFFGQVADHKTPVNAKCVPVWQQNIQGKCNGRQFLPAELIT